MIVVNDILTTDIDFNDTYVAIGNFDGVHYGHKKLIKEAIKAARENGKQAVVFTFEKHPMEVLFPERKFEYINTNEEKLYLLESLGVDVVIMQKIDKDFLEYTPLEFVRILKNKTIREMNWEVANETKTLNTGNYQIKMIKYIGEKIGLNSLSPVLEEAAFLRLNNPEDSLQSLADMINISKSGIRNRFRRIEEIYNSLLEEEKNS